MLEINQTLSILSEENKQASKIAAKITAGNILNERAIKLVKPQLPLMVRSYADTQLGQAVICNLIAGAIMHVAPTNEKAVLASEVMIQSAMTNFVNSFNIEDMVNDFLDGVNLETFRKAEEA